MRHAPDSVCDIVRIHCAACSGLCNAITLDLHLPGTPGTEIYDMLEKRGDAKKVLVISAYLDEIKDFEIRGVNALQKPVLSIDLLVDRVREIAEQKVPALR